MLTASPPTGKEFDGVVPPPVRFYDGKTSSCLAPYMTQSSRFSPDTPLTSTRKLRLQAMPDGNALKQLLQAIEGVQAMELSGNRLAVSYDVAHIDFGMLVQELNDGGFEIDEGSWWLRMRGNFYRFVDQNMRDNASYSPHCCSAPPPSVNRPEKRRRQ